MKPGLFLILLLIMLTSICDTINQLFLKTAVNSLASPNNLNKIFRFIIQLILTPKVWISFIFSVLSLCIWLFVLSRADLNFAFSVDSMHYIFIALACGLILKEKVGLKRWTGILFIILGIILVSFN